MGTGTIELPVGALDQEVDYWLGAMRPPRLRSLREFAEEEIILPGGPYEGRRFRCERQPFIGLWFDAIDSGLWQRHVATGPSQSGKSLGGFVAPCLYHLFEVAETYILGIPTRDMVADKWNEDLLPVIARTRYAHLLPDRGGASKGGMAMAIRMRNGATLRFMTGGGGDKARAAFTSRCLGATEIDGMDEAGEASREADPIAQMEARLRSFGARAVEYLECTVSVKGGRVWREYEGGTRSAIVVPCPRCRRWVSPEREHLVGWKTAESEWEAEDQAAFCCPDCGSVWDAAERRDMNAAARLLHRGQTIGEDGTIEGEPIRTRTFSMRWNAFHNLFWEPGDIGRQEWLARQSALDAGADPDAGEVDENAEKELCQFVWAIPFEPPDPSLYVLTSESVAKRTEGLKRGELPADCAAITVGVDVGRFRLYWTAIAWGKDGRGYVIEYDVVNTHATGDRNEEECVLAAASEVWDIAMKGWAGRPADAVFFDSGYLTKLIIAFCRSRGRRCLPVRGLGQSQDVNPRAYTHPNRKTNEVRTIGENYCVRRLQAEKWWRVDVNVDEWKLWLRRRLLDPLGSRGAITLFSVRNPERDHKSFSKHLTAEHQETDAKTGRVVWVADSSVNHWGDSTVYACVAGHWVGVRVVQIETTGTPAVVGTGTATARKGWYGRRG